MKTRTIRKAVLLGAVRMILTLAALQVAMWALSQPSSLAVLAGGIILVGILWYWVPQAFRAAQRFMAMFFLIFVAASAQGCATRVEPGHAGIKVHLYGGKKGVDVEPVPTGMIWYAPWSTVIYEYPTFIQTAVWLREDTKESPGNEEVSFNTSEGMVVTADISLSYSLRADAVPDFFTKFRTDDLRQFTHGFMRNIARDAFNEEGAKYGVEQVYGEKKEEILQAVRARINAAIQPYGVTVEQFGFVGAPRLPENVVDALNGKIKATQDAIRVENELRATEAEAKKRIAAAQGEAESNRLLAESLSERLLEWRSLEITEKAVAKWNGARPQVEGGSAGLLLQVK